MNTLKMIVCGVGLGALLVAGGACGGDPLKKMEEFADRMCECKDQACVKTVNTDMMDWMKANVDKARAPSDSDKQKAQELMERMMKCSNEASMAGGEVKDEAAKSKAKDEAE